MKRLSVFCGLLFVFSCQSIEEKRTQQFNTDSLKIESDKKIEKIIDSFKKQSLFDTIGDNNPINVIKAEIVKNEYSNYKEIQITYKNISNQKIDAIKFRWYGVNAFGEPADMGSPINEGFGNGFMDDGISKDKTNCDKFNILSRDAKKVVKAWAYEVVFSDGSKWESHSN